MICLDNTDTLEGGASVNAVVDYTVHGLVGTTFTNIAQGQLSDTDPSVLYTAAAGIAIVSIMLVNTHNAAVTVNLYIDPTNAGTPRRIIPKNMSLGIGYALHFDGSKMTVLDATGQLVTTYGIHKTHHQDGGDDEISVTGLSGLLADDQHVLNAEVSAVPGLVVQVVNYETGEVASGSTTIPWDDTIPQKTEGDEYMTLAITPKNVNNILIIQVSFFGALSSVAYMIMALFQDTNADALAATAAVILSGNAGMPFNLIHKMVAGTTSPTTFKVRAGPESASTLTFNGASAARKFGGVMASSITITEVAV